MLNIILNNSTFSTKSEDSFISASEFIESKTLRTRIPTKSLKIIPTTYDTYVAEVDYPNTCVKGKFPIAPSAISSLLARAKISGQALSKVSPTTFSLIVNSCLETNTDDTVLVTYNSTIYAFLSTDYKPIDMSDIFASSAKKVREIGGTFKYGDASISEINGYWTLNKSLINSNNLPTLYTNKTLPVLRVTSSNVGFSGANIFPMLTNGRYNFIIGKPLLLEHKGNADSSKFQANLNQIYALFRKSIETIESLKKIPINFPTYAFVNACKSIGIGKKLTSFILRDFNEILEMSDEKPTAYDIYIGITEALYYAESLDFSKDKIMGLQEQIAKLLFVNWTELDVPASL